MKKELESNFFVVNSREIMYNKTCMYIYVEFSKNIYWG